MSLLHLSSVCRAGLQNDHKDIMKQIETKLYDLHAQSSSTAESPMEVNGEHDAVNYVAFAHVDHVDSGSPASSAVTGNCVYMLFHC